MSVFKDKDSKPLVVNGIKFANRNEYEERLKQDALQLAQLLHDMYRKGARGKSKL